LTGGYTPDKHGGYYERLYEDFKTWSGEMIMYFRGYYIEG
jgi:hypothetical protein